MVGGVCDFTTILVAGADFDGQRVSDGGCGSSASENSFGKFFLSLFTLFFSWFLVA